MALPKTLSPAHRGNGGEARETISFGKRSISLLTFPMSDFNVSQRAFTLWDRVQRTSCCANSRRAPIF